MRSPIRLLRLDRVSGLRSQTVYHALARSVSQGAPNTLAILWPANAYVSVGYHRDLISEVDLDFCRQRDIPVYRREVGGGPVYLDTNQVFFQLVVHHQDAPATVERCYASWLQPAAETYRALGVPAAISSLNDLTVEGRKLSGTAMGRIKDATVLVGNIILDFDHATMARVLQLPDEAFRAEVEARMRTTISSLRAELGKPVSHETVEDELVRQFGRGLGADLAPEKLTEGERQLLGKTERWFLSRRWRYDGVQGPESRVQSHRRGSSPGSRVQSSAQLHSLSTVQSRGGRQSPGSGVSSHGTDGAPDGGSVVDPATMIPGPRLRTLDPRPWTAHVRMVKIRGGLHMLLASAPVKGGRLQAMVAAEGGCIARLQFAGQPGLEPLEIALAGRAFTSAEIERALAEQDGHAEPAALAAARTCLLQAAAQVLD